MHEQLRVEAARKARFPWESPEVIQAMQRQTGYNFKFDPVLYLKTTWIVDNVGGMKSMQVFLEHAARRYAEELLEANGAGSGSSN